MDQFEYIRTTYNVPAEYGAIILFRGNPHRIVGAENGRLVVNPLGSETQMRLHPTWEVNYNWKSKEEKEHDELGDIAIELQSLRAWKAKARPFLEQQVATLTSVIPGAKNLNSDAKTDVICLVEKKLNELTELLGGDDE